EALRPPEDVCAGDEVLLPGEDTWAVVKTISAPDDSEVVWITFTNGERLGFHTDGLVTVRRPVPAPAAQPALAVPALATPPARQAAPVTVQAATVDPGRFALQSVVAAQPRTYDAQVKPLAAPQLVPLTGAEQHEFLRLRAAALPHAGPPGKSDRED